MKKILMSMFLCLGVAAMACESNETEARFVDEVELRSALQTKPSGLAQKDQDWGCEGSVYGRFRGFNTTHMYSFPGKLGYSYTFSADAKYEAGFGVVLALFDSQTRSLLNAGLSMGSSVSVEWEARDSEMIDVVVMSLSFYARGEYGLTANCELNDYCVEWSYRFGSTDEAGNPYESFYAEHVHSIEEAHQLLDAYPGHFNEAIQKGKCYENLEECTRTWAPVCGNISYTGDTNTFPNPCRFKNRVRELTKDNEPGYKGYFVPGECRVEKTFCLEYEKIETWEPQNGFFAANVASEEEAKAILEAVGPTYNEQLHEGTCRENVTACTKDCPGICAIVPEPNSFYCNVCIFKNYVREVAGDTENGKGHYEKGHCKPVE